MKRTLWSCVATIIAVGLVAPVVPAQAQALPYDHLKCYKIKEKRAFLAPAYNADLVPEQKPLFGDENCNIKMKAKLFCIDVRKENVTPAPPGAPAGPQAGDYLCYKFKQKCSPQIAAGMTVDVTDQFASGMIVVKKAGMLCVPATKKMTTTTTSSTSTTSSSSTSSSTSTSTTLVSGDCQQIGTNPPLCGGACVVPGEVCVWVPSLADCRCGTTTTTTLPLFTCDPALTQSPECDGTCPLGEICVAPGTCQFSTDPCLSDADCVASAGPCMHGPCNCVPSIGVACGGIGAPECYGDCNPNEVCRVVNVTACQCF